MNAKHLNFNTAVELADGMASVGDTVFDLDGRPLLYLRPSMTNGEIATGHVIGDSTSIQCPRLDVMADDFNELVWPHSCTGWHISDDLFVSQSNALAHRVKLLADKVADLKAALKRATNDLAAAQHALAVVESVEAKTT